jgi:hypothetical protein
MKFFWVCVALAAALAALVLVGGLATANGAPQQAAVAAVAVAIAVIPYIFARAIEGWESATWRALMIELTQKGRADFKAGTDSLWKQLDAIRSMAAPSLPPTWAEPRSAGPSAAPLEAVRPLPAEMGKCPACGRPRMQFTDRCEGCGSTRPTIFS